MSNVNSNILTRVLLHQRFCASRARDKEYFFLQCSMALNLELVVFQTRAWLSSLMLRHVRCHATPRHALGFSHLIWSGGV